MTKHYKLTTCGLSCDLCDSNTSKLQNSAKYFLKVFEDPMFKGVLLMTSPEFKQENFSGFIDTLEVLKNYPPCPGCQERGDCTINQCAHQKGIGTCGECKFIDLEVGLCKDVPVQSGNPMIPPAPIFFQGLSKRYQNWNIENFKAIAKEDKDKVNSRIEKMIKEGKSSRDLVDISVNLFEAMK
jgi:hypothetical protein